MLEVNAKIWLEMDNKCIIGKGRAELLNRIKELGSLRKAAESMDMSYSHAWEEIKEISEAAGGPVIEAERGGKGGGSSHLTELGEKILKKFDEEKESLDSYLSERND